MISERRRLDKPIHAKAFLQRIQELEDVLECFHVTGDMDYLLKVRTRSTTSLEKIQRWPDSNRAAPLRLTRTAASSLGWEV